MTAFDIRFDGKIALITGGGAGIGRAVAEAFASLGANVAVAEVDAARAHAVRSSLAAVGGDHLVVTADVRKTAQVVSLVEQIRIRYGRLDVLVNNVGDNLGLRGSFERFSEQEWDALYEINLRHLFVATRAALPLIRSGGRGGSIINVSTIEAFRGAPPCAVYSAFKTAITGFTKSLALELAPEGIRVNVIAPETTETAQVPISAVIKPQYSQHAKHWIPLGRFGTPDDAAGCAVFLASSLSGWVTGTTIHLDGGALAAGGFYRTTDGRWTNFPVITDDGITRRT